MRSYIWGGILFIVLGGFALAYQGFTYTHQEKVLDVGPIHATAEKHEHVSIPPILGGLALVGGLSCSSSGAKKKFLARIYESVPPESRATHNPLLTQMC